MRLIDADEMAVQESEAYLKVNTREDISPITQGINSVVHRKIQELIANTPTIEAEPVRHGRWEEESQNSAYYGKLVSCSECGAFLDPKKVKAYRFCYNCGAKMRGDSHD